MSDTEKLPTDAPEVETQQTEVNSEIATSETSSEETTTIEETKQQLATMYLNFLDKQKGGIVGTTAGFGVNLNPLQKEAIEYLVSDTDVKEKSDFFSNIGKNIGKNIKKKVMEKVTGGTVLEYDRASLSKMKALIVQNKDDKAKLEALMSQIQEGIDPTTTTSTVSTEKNPVPETNTSLSTEAVVLPLYMRYKKLKPENGITKEEIVYVEKNAKSMVEKLETKGYLSNIAEIKDTSGNVVLKCRGKTPYMNNKAVVDLIGFALLFYKKTGIPFVLESGYRTIEYQKILKEQNKKSGTPTADPGYSGHNLGLSIDVSQNTRYDTKIGGIQTIKKIAEMFDFHPISSEDRHFDHTEFVDTYYKNKEARLPLAQKIEKDFLGEEERSQAA